MLDPVLREAIGGLAACLTTVSFVPQALHIIRRRDTAAISLAMYLCFGAGIALWLVYGLLIASWPLIAANGITLALVAAIIALKLKLG